MISFNVLFVALALGKALAHSNHYSLQARFDDDLGPEPRALGTYGDLYNEALSYRDLSRRAGGKPPVPPKVDPVAGPSTDQTNEDNTEEYIRNECKLTFRAGQVQWIKIDVRFRSRRQL